MRPLIVSSVFAATSALALPAFAGPASAGDGANRMLSGECNGRIVYDHLNNASECIQRDGSTLYAVRGRLGLSWQAEKPVITINRIGTLPETETDEDDCNQNGKAQSCERSNVVGAPLPRRHR